MTQTEAGRYGASLVAFIVGGYLLVSVNVGFISQIFRGTVGPEVFTPFAIALFVAVAAIVLHPASGTLRAIAVMLVVIGVVLLLIYLLSHYGGTFTFGRDLAPFTQIVLRWDAVVITLLTAAWLIVRRSNPVSFVFLPLTVLIGLVGYFLLLQGVPAIVANNITMFVGLIVALGIVWIAAALSRGRRAGTGRPQPSYTPVPGASYGPVATDEPSAAPVADPYPPAR